MQSGQEAAQALADAEAFITLQTDAWGISTPELWWAVWIGAAP